MCKNTEQQSDTGTNPTAVHQMVGGSIDTGNVKVITRQDIC